MTNYTKTLSDAKNSTNIKFLTLQTCTYLPFILYKLTFVLYSTDLPFFLTLQTYLPSLLYRFTFLPYFTDLPSFHTLQTYLPSLLYRLTFLPYCTNLPSLLYKLTSLPYCTNLPSFLTIQTYLSIIPSWWNILFFKSETYDFLRSQNQFITTCDTQRWLCFHRRLFVNRCTPSPSHNTSTGPMSFLGVPHIHPIILQLVPYPFQGVPHFHPIIVPLVPRPFPEGVPQ